MRILERGWMDVRRWASGGAVVVLAMAAAGCQGPGRVVVKDEPTARASPPVQTSDDTPATEVVETRRVPPPADDPERWLYLEKAKPGAPGGWATGTFHPQRNKIEIHTRDVEGFAIDTSRIAIDWVRLVVLGIDGRNSELKKRDYDVLHFQRDEHGQWVVVER